MTPVLISGPLLEPVSLVEAKQWLRVDTSVEDDLIAALVTSARMIVESATRRQLISQTWRLTMDRWPGRATAHDGFIGRPELFDIPLAPFRQIIAFRVFDALNIAMDIGSSLYVLDATPDRARLRFTGEPPLPGRCLAGIEMDLLVGYGDTPTDTPEPLRQAIRLLIARWFENRGDIEPTTSIDRLPGAVAALLAPYRRARLA
jgi:uncharacterized phiE125 gp8 family phage protein